MLIGANNRTNNTERQTTSDREALIAPFLPLPEVPDPSLRSLRIFGSVKNSELDGEENGWV